MGSRCKQEWHVAELQLREMAHTEWLLPGRHCTRFFTCVISLNYHSKSTQKTFFFHFIGDKTEAPRAQVP